VIDGSTNQVIATIAVGIQPGGIALDSHTNEVYVASEFPPVIHYGPYMNYSNLTEINATTNEVTALLPMHSNPIHVAYDPANGDLYVANAGANVTVVNATSNTILGSIPVGDQPVDLAFDPVNGYVYSANLGSNNVTVIGALPPLASVAIAPSAALVPTNGTQLFATTLACARGGCPTGATFAWSVSNDRATVNSSSSPVVALTARSSLGPVTLFVNVTLNSRTLGSSALVTVVPGLTSVTISPSKASLSRGGSQTFTATPVCASGACPSEVRYAWTLTSDSYGGLNTTFGPTVSFGSTAAGSLSVEVNATALNQTVRASAPISVVAPTPSVQVGGVTFPWYELTALVVGAIAVVAVALFFLIRRRRRREEEPFRPLP